MRIKQNQLLCQKKIKYLSISDRMEVFRHNKLLISERAKHDIFKIMEHYYIYPIIGTFIVILFTLMFVYT